MEQPRVDQPLSVERLTPTDLIAAARAVATIVAINHARKPAPGQVPFVLSASWYAGRTESWSIKLRDASVALDTAAHTEAERLLQPILQAMRPRAVKHFFRSPMDEATLEDWNTIGNAGVLPSASAYEPRWVADTTVLEVSAGGGTLEEARSLLAEIGGRLGIKSAESTPIGFIGMSLDEAAKTHFFQWFSFAAAAPPVAETTVFKPDGSKFHDLATLSVTVGANGRIALIDLAITRSFIEDPREGMFAADLGKSFLEAALPPDDQAAMQHLIDTIGYGGTYERPVITGAPGAANLQIVRDSAPYLVWLDGNEYWHRPVGAVSLRLENARLDGAAVLRITVGAKTADTN
jgi:hypothetical protein